MLQFWQMSSGVVSATIQLKKSKAGNNIEQLQRLLLGFAFVNLFIVALIGLLLRSSPFLSSFPLEYKNILHGHSHFAFGGWVMPALLGLLIKCFPELKERIAYRHWRNMSFLLLFSAYGMLFSFPLLGYKAISILFSTLSIASGFYLAITVWKALPFLKPSVPLQFLNSGLFYMVLSSVGPLATGPLIAMGKTGTPLYFDVIYFYLHFQYNGLFLFSVLALFYKYFEEKRIRTNSLKVFRLLNMACIPTYFLSVLWHQPSMLFNAIGGIGALIQCFALIYLLRDLRLLRFENKLATTLVQFSFASLSLKIILQLFSAMPEVATLAYNYRNFVMAYLHLVLLGVISLFLIGWVIRSLNVAVTKTLKTGISLSVIAFIFTEFLLTSFPLSIMMHYSHPLYSLLIFLLAILLSLGIAIFITPLIYTIGKKNPVENYRVALLEDVIN